MERWPNTLLDTPKLKFLIKQCDLAANLEGDVAEVGVYKGGTANVLATCLPEKTIHLFDTWAGMPTPSEIDGHKPGDFKSSLDETMDFLSNHDRIQFYPGLFPDTAYFMNDKRFCLVHVDVDLYESTKAACEFFWPKMVRGGIMVFDDYNHTLCKGANKAIDEFFYRSEIFEFNDNTHKTGLRIVK